jgi:hypothetical protein
LNKVWWDKVRLKRGKRKRGLTWYIIKGYGRKLEKPIDVFRLPTRTLSVELHELRQFLPYDEIGSVVDR